MDWNADLYDGRHGFVAAYGSALLEGVDRRPDRRILDVGCGTGTLTVRLAAGGADVLGIDSSPEMIDRARQNNPRCRFECLDATTLSFNEEFDTVFSNAVFHWILAQDQLLRGLYSALKPGGVLVCEFGAKGNVRAMRQAFAQAMGEEGHRVTLRFFLPDEGEYAALLKKAGFQAESVTAFDRPTSLDGGPEGLQNWLRQFFSVDLSPLSPEAAARVVERTEAALRHRLFKGGQWVLDYRRLRARARK